MAKDQNQPREVSRLPEAGPSAPSAPAPPPPPTTPTAAMLSSQQTFRVVLKGCRSRKIDDQGRIYYADHLDVGAIGPGEARLVFERYNGITSTSQPWQVDRVEAPAEVWVGEVNQLCTAWDAQLAKQRADRAAEKAAKRGRPVNAVPVQPVSER